MLRIGSQMRTVVLGPADRATARPVTADDRFAVASITKSLLATAVMKYVADGTVGLDDPASRWVPRLKTTKPITVRQFLTHRSGLHSEDAWWDAKYTDLDVVRLSVEHALDFPPGSDGAYSNMNYVVLGLLLEKVSGRRLSEVLKDKVFKPAGMTSTTLGGTPTVLGYDGGAVVDPGLNGPGAAAGGVISTAADIDRFYRHLFAGDLVPPRLVRAMSTPTGTVPLGVGEYGLGLWTWTMRCADGIGHSGSLFGFSSKAWTMPDKGRSIVVLVNESDGEDHLTAAVADNALCS